MEDRRHHDEFPPNSRIFIGNLDPSVYEEDIKSTFKRYGRIGEIVMRKSFAFVQFDSPDQAQNAIAKENGENIKSRKMSLSLAKARNSKHERKEDVPFHSQNKRSRHENPRRRQNSGGGPPTRWGGRVEKDRDHHRDEQPSFYDRQQSQPQMGDHGDHYHGNMGGRSGGGPYGDRNVAAYDQFSQSIQPGPSFRQNDTNPYEGAPCSSGMSAFEISSNLPNFDRGNQQERRTNDVEIVCSNRSIIEYAESIENRLISMGLKVDVLYPNPDFPLSKVLGSITNRGVRYAMLITPMSRENRSVTLNVLQGVQQEHRNMPLDDAFYFVSNNLSSGGNYEGNMPKSHPREIMTLLELLIQNKTLALSDYDDLIRYLCKCREEVLGNDNERNIPSHSFSGPSSGHSQGNFQAKQGDYYEKILNILNNKSDVSSRYNESRSNDQNESAPINPSLQKAIDSLIKTGPNLLNQIKKLEVPPRESTDSNVNNVLSSYYSSLFKNDNSNNRPSGSGGGGNNNLFSAYGGGN
ncbi:nuclear receptor coactivator 5 [Lepeophtheirus salmonis]|uniref:nuclear receptor coactivator 5 n=1 Tax=Lepeophtheirus salmonis TaxID=72036 RepID=UPI001AE0EA7A|nr:nuclear receptor coactivator 5-like isoform X1 [Lepeophtheirus salmonis]